MIHARDLFIQPTAHGVCAAVKHVCVDHGGFDILVPEQFLYGADIVAGLKQVCGEGVAEGVWTDASCDLCLVICFFNRALQYTFIQVMASDYPGKWINRSLRCWKNVLPSPSFTGIGIFNAQGVGRALVARREPNWEDDPFPAARCSCIERAAHSGLDSVLMLQHAYLAPGRQEMPGFPEPPCLLGVVSCEKGYNVLSSQYRFVLFDRRNASFSMHHIPGQAISLVVQTLVISCAYAIL